MILKNSLRVVIFLLFVSFSTWGQEVDSSQVLLQDSLLKPVKDSTGLAIIDSAHEAGRDSTVQGLRPPDFKKLISIPKIIWSILFLIIGYLFLQLFDRLVNFLAERYTRYRLVIKSTIPIVKIFGWIFIIFVIIAGIFQPPWTTIVAFSASIGVAVGFASQDILKNIFGGVTILFDRPFKVGDKIEIGKYYGEVVEIGLRSTRIVTADDSLVTVPNGELMNQSVSNSNSGESNCQVVTEIYLPVTINTSQVREIAIEAVKVSRYVYLNKSITILFSHEIREKQDYLKMKVKAYVLDIRDEFRFKSDMTELVIRELVSRGIMKDH